MKKQKLEPITRNQITPLVGFIRDRHLIYLQKQKNLSPPWTKDPILSEVRFSNVFLELDSFSVWLSKNIYKRFEFSPNLWLMVLMARRIGTPSVISKLIALQSSEGKPVWPVEQETLNLEALELALTIMRRKASYEISNPLIKNKQAPSALVKHTIAPIWEDRQQWREWWMTQPTLQQTWGLLQSKDYYGLSGQCGYLAVTDLAKTHYLRTATDLNTWAYLTPAVLDSFSHLKIKLGENYLERMLELLKIINDHPVWPVSRFGELKIHDLWRCLNMFDKYYRMARSGLRRSPKYKPRTSK